MAIKTIRIGTIIAFLLSGCVSPSSSPPATTEGEPHGISDNVAIVTLVNNAKSAILVGKLDAADLSLERALHIEPRNPNVWYELANLRLQQAQFDQAAYFAAKSNAFAGSDRTLQAANWQIIGQARAKHGDTVGAQDAFSKAAALAN